MSQLGKRFRQRSMWEPVSFKRGHLALTPAQIQRIPFADRRAQRFRQASARTQVARSLLPPPSRVEKKNIDRNGTTDASATESVNLLNGCVQGVTDSTRVGRRVLMKSVQVRARISRESASSSTIQQVRLAIVYDRQSNGAAPVFGTDVYSGGVSNVTMLRNLANGGRFQVLADEVLTVGATSTDLQTGFWEKYIRLNHPVYYNAVNGGTVADIQTGGLFFCYIGNTAAGSDDVDVLWESRVRYTDS